MAKRLAVLAVAVPLSRLSKVPVVSVSVCSVNALPEVIVLQFQVCAKLALSTELAPVAATSWLKVTPV